MAGEMQQIYTDITSNGVFLFVIPCLNILIGLGSLLLNTLVCSFYRYQIKTILKGRECSYLPI